MPIRFTYFFIYLQGEFKILNKKKIFIKNIKLFLSSSSRKKVIRESKFQKQRDQLLINKQMDFLNQLLGGGRGGGGNYNQQLYAYNRKPQYSDNLEVYPAFMLERDDLEKGNKILLPPTVLNTLSASNLPYPMIFCVQNTYLNKQTYVGVLEFIAPEGTCYIPFWMFQMLQCFDGQQIQVTLVTDVKKGKFVKIQPHETAFIDLPDPRAILEKELRNYTVLHQGDTIHIEFMKQQFQIDILEVKPPNDYHAICVVDAEIEVDFAKPLDYVEHPLPTMTKKESSVVMGEENQPKKEKNPFSGKATRIDGKAIDQKKLKMKEEVKEDYDPRKHRLPNGVRRKILNNDFMGKSTVIGKSMLTMNKKK
ncbi:hypothetical protein ABPG72_009076 [Tetrahymena utriculariae]